MVLHRLLGVAGTGQTVIGLCQQRGRVRRERQCQSQPDWLDTTNTVGASRKLWYGSATKGSTTKYLLEPFVECVAKHSGGVSNCLNTDCMPFAGGWGVQQSAARPCRTCQKNCEVPVEHSGRLEIPFDKEIRRRFRGSTVLDGQSSAVIGRSEYLTYQVLIKFCGAAYVLCLLLQLSTLPSAPTVFSNSNYKAFCDPTSTPVQTTCGCPGFISYINYGTEEYGCVTDCKDHAVTVTCATTASWAAPFN